MKERVKIVENILVANDEIAKENLAAFNQNNILAMNIMASPGAGKTSVILEIIKHLKNKYHLGVIEGDTTSVTIDADKVNKLGIPAVQINTGGNCHLDANMVKNAIKHLSLDTLDLVIIENVGNLICPAAFQLGTHKNIVIASIPEGDDKPYKYPAIYRGIDVLILNKLDLLPYVDFDINYFEKGIRILNPQVQFFKISCKTGKGFKNWMNWLESQILEFKT